MFNLGDVLMDEVTGFTGVAIAKIEYLNGCVQYELTPQKLTKDGDPIKAFWVDDQQLAYVGDGLKVQPKKTGGPAPTNLPRRGR